MDYEKTSALSVLMFLICSVSASVYIISNMKKNGGQNERLKERGRHCASVIFAKKVPSKANQQGDFLQ